MAASFTLNLKDGARIALQKWGCKSSILPKPSCMLLHGWLDNSDSFSALGPFLASKGYEVYAMDHIGHGLSSHAQGSQPFSDFVLHTRETMMQLELTKVNVIGHSMGTAIGVMLAGAYPECIASLVCIDGISIWKLDFANSSSIRAHMTFICIISNQGSVQRGSLRARLQKFYAGRSIPACQPLAEG